MGKVQTEQTVCMQTPEAFASMASLNYKKNASSWTVKCEVDGRLER